MSGRGLRIAMVVYDDITFDSRVQREATSLARAGHDVTIFCQGYRAPAAPLLDHAVRVELIDEAYRPSSPDRAGAPARRGARRWFDRSRYLRAYYRNLLAWGRAVGAAQAAVDVWHAHDFTGLVAASIARRNGSRLVYDMHDLFLDTEAGARLPRPIRAALAAYERRLARRADLVVTVNDAMAAHIRRHLDPPSPVIAVHNCPPRWTVPAPRPTLIRDALGIDAAAPVLLYHGAMAADRHLDALLEAMLEPGLEAAHLLLLGFGPDKSRLETRALEARFGGRIHLLDAVPPSELMLWVASADVGVMVMPATSTTLYVSTPNKLFECLTAGVPVVTSDFPAVRQIVLDPDLGPLGAVCDPGSVPTIAAAIASLVGLDRDAGDAVRARCAAAAARRWNWESEAVPLTGAYSTLEGSRT